MNLIRGVQLQTLCLPLLLMAGIIIVGVQAHRDYSFLSVRGTEIDPLAVSEHDEPSVQPIGINEGFIYLMGKQAEKIEEKIKLEEIPETRLNFTLLGVFDSRSHILGGAVIDTGTLEPGFFQVGDELSEDVVLVAVIKEGVVISRSGKRELLSYDESLLKINEFSRNRNLPAVTQFQLQNKSD